MTTSPAAALARAMVGEPGSRYRLPTPALIVDEAKVDANIAAMAARVGAGVGLRPHAKTHKSAWIAGKQIARGAVGVCCAKLGEVEALSAAGVREILLTSPVADESSLRRLCRIARVDPGFRCVVDHPEAVTTLAAEAGRCDVGIAVLIDVDVGLMRTGVAGPAEAVALAAHIARFPSLTLAGVQGYGGHWQHIAGYAARRDAVHAGMARLSRVIEALRDNGHRVETVTGGGTGTVQADLELGVLNELQPGSYVFMDVQYTDALGEDADGAFATGLWVSSQVVSTNAEPIVTVDAGLKAFATDGPAPRPVTAPFTDSTYAFFGDEHGAITRPPGTEVRLADRIELVTPHCDPTVDRYDDYHVVHGDTVVAIIPIDAARASR
ncbi:DSD1 family PLP-dependent enzyme [Nocardia sp.]|uniref:DSD1 family PLP-dependent enzyme n=1 Tax=Nocardia sp. TaxID=1821 RepID=UPI0025868342|nr:DSD1 family PLP-dependent enzyme [Nocardia sp.]